MPMEKNVFAIRSAIFLPFGVHVILDDDLHADPHMRDDRDQRRRSRESP